MEIILKLVDTPVINYGLIGVLFVMFIPVWVALILILVKK